MPAAICGSGQVVHFRVRRDAILTNILSFGPRISTVLSEEIRNGRLTITCLDAQFASGALMLNRLVLNGEGPEKLAARARR